MNIQVRYFASLREALGPSERIDMPAGSSVAQLRDVLLALGGRHAQVLAGREQQRGSQGGQAVGRQ